MGRDDFADHGISPSQFDKCTLGYERSEHDAIVQCQRFRAQAWIGENRLTNMIGVIKNHGIEHRGWGVGPFGDSETNGKVRVSAKAFQVALT